MSGFNQEIADRICEWIAEGKSLREFCRQEGMPCFKTVYIWRKENEEFRMNYSIARQVGFDMIAEEALAIADTPVEGERREVGGKHGDRSVYEDMLGHRKLQVETRLKLLAKWSPDKYGDMVKLAGADGGPLETVNRNVNLVARITPERADRDYLEIIKRTKTPA